MFLITYFVCLTDVVFLFALHSTFRNFYIHADEEVTQTRHKKNEFFALLNNTSFVTSLSVSGSHFCSTSLCSRFFVTLALPKLLCLGNKIKKSFLFSLYYSLGSSTRVTRLFVTFTSMRMKKLLRLGIKKNEFFALLNNTSFVTSLSVSGSHFCSTSLCSRFFVTLALPKLLCLGNKIKKSFFFLCIALDFS